MLTKSSKSQLSQQLSETWERVLGGVRVRTRATEQPQASAGLNPVTQKVTWDPGSLGEGAPGTRRYYIVCLYSYACYMI